MSQIKMNSTKLKQEIEEMRSLLGEAKDSMKRMEESALLLQEHWQGEAREIWMDNLFKKIQTDTEHVDTMLKLLTKAEGMGRMIVATEQYMMGWVQEG